MFREMDYVYAVYQERSFTKAAQKMYLSQPALSAMVKKAEHKIGMPIFDRSTSPLTLTEAGEYYIQQAEKIRAIQQEAREHFSRASRSRDTTLRLCGAAIYQAYVFPPIIAAFLAQYPDVTVSWAEARTGLVQKLLTGEIDLFPEVNNYLNKEVDGIAWRDEELVLVVPAEHSINETMAAYRFTPGQIRDGKHRLPEARSVDLSAFQDMNYILMDEENDTYQRAVTICQNAGFIPRTVSMKPAQMLTAYQLAQQSKAATFVSDTLVEYADKNYPVCLYKLSDPLAQRQQYLYFKRGGERNAAVRQFCDFILSCPMPRGGL